MEKQNEMKARKKEGILNPENISLLENVKSKYILKKIYKYLQAKNLLGIKNSTEIRYIFKRL